jgi:hypothetical protein
LNTSSLKVEKIKPKTRRFLLNISSQQQQHDLDQVPVDWQATATLSNSNNKFGVCQQQQQGFDQVPVGRRATATLSNSNNKFVVSNNSSKA